MNLTQYKEVERQWESRTEWLAGEDEKLEGAELFLKVMADLEVRKLERGEWK